MSASVLYDAPGPATRRRIALQGYAGAAFLVLLAAVVIWRLATKGQLDSERWAALTQPAVLRTLFNGLLDTLQAAAVAMLLSLVVGTVLAVARLSDAAVLRWVTRVWIELFRGLPLLLVILFIYLGAPSIGITLPVFWSLVLGLMLYNSAVIAEIIRAGILSLPRGQREAALAIGLRPGQAMQLVLLPQAVRLMLPALISQLVTLLKDTSLGFVIGYTELLRNGRTAVEFLGGSYSLPIYTAMAVVYIGVNMVLSYCAREVDRRQARRLGQSAARTGEPAALADEAA